MSDSPDLDLDALRLHIGAYAASRNWQVRHVVREERGVLPIVLGGDFDCVLGRGSGRDPALGAAGRAVPPDDRLLAGRSGTARRPHRGAAGSVLGRARREIRSYARERWRAQGLFRMLNRMMFRAGAPERRYRIMQRFYRLPEDLIGRFYAGEPSWADSLRLLAGRPPVPLGAALIAAFSADRRARA